MNSRTLKILISLFLLNSVSLYLYFSSHPDYFRHKSPPEDHRQTEYRKPFPLPYLTTYSSSLAKPWPILPSYLPWSLNPNVPFRSCEGYFGNGFTRHVDLLKSSQGGGGWFRCLYSETLRSSICEGGRVRMHPDKIKMSIGGEKLETVIGRGEDHELPEFDFGAFDFEAINRVGVGKKLATEEFLDQYVPRGVISRHTMRDLIDSIQLVGASEYECSEETLS